MGWTCREVHRSNHVNFHFERGLEAANKGEQAAEGPAGPWGILKITSLHSSLMNTSLP